MQTYWDFKNVKILSSLIFIIIVISCTPKYSKKDVFFDLNKKCEALPTFNPKEWVLVKYSESYWEFEKTKGNVEYMTVYQDTTELLGYYMRNSENEYLRIRLKDCDTLLYYKVSKMDLKRDTIFIRGYYQYLYDENKLNAGQKRFFKRNLDSLISIRGGNLKPLPETNVPSLSR